MRKAIVAGAVVVLLVGAAFVVAPAVRSQDRSSEERGRDRRVFMLDGRGSAIGVSIRDREAGDGVLIEDVEEDGPAAKAGIRDGDVIVEFDGERVRSARQFARLVQETPDGRSVKATIVRGGGRQTVDVTPHRGNRTADLLMPGIAGDIEREVERSLRALPKNFAFDFNWDAEGYPMGTVWSRGRLGAQLSPLTDQLAAYFGTKEGVLVSSVEPESAAAKAGLKAGDVITSINGRSVESPRDVTQELRAADAGKEVEIAIVRDKKAQTLKAQLPESGRSTRPRYVRPA